MERKRGDEEQEEEVYLEKKEMEEEEGRNEGENERGKEGKRQNMIFNRLDSETNQIGVNLCLTYMPEST